MRDWSAPPQSLDRLVDRAALGRPLEAPLTLEQRFETIAGEHKQPLRGGRRPRGPGNAPQGSRQNRPQREAEWRAVVVRHPAPQLEQWRRDRRLIVRCRGNWLDLDIG